MSQGAFVFIVNPMSANGTTLRRFERVREQFARELSPLGEVQVRLTERPRHATELARRAIDEGAKAVISVGGDGTNNEIVNGFFDADGKPVGETAFGQVTSGTGGDFRRTFAWKGEPLDDLARLRRFQIRTIDVGRATVTLDGGGTASFMYLNSGGFGVNGAVVNAVNQSSKALGARMSFLAGAVRAFLAFKPQMVQWQVDDGPPQEAPVTLITASNGQYFGGGMHIAPDARPDDGTLDVVVVDGIALPKFLRHAPELYAGTHVKHPFVHVSPAKKLTARPMGGDERVLVELDGEQPGFLPATFEVVPQSLRLLV